MFNERKDVLPMGTDVSGAKVTRVCFKQQKAWRMRYENALTSDEQKRADMAQTTTNHELFKRGYDVYKAQKSRNKRRVLIGGEDAKESK